jgi:hypothetical protein
MIYIGALPVISFLSGIKIWFANHTHERNTHFSSTSSKTICSQIFMSVRAHSTRLGIAKIPADHSTFLVVYDSALLPMGFESISLV